ncbi:MAG TPA: glycosyltransferase family 1 protein, partial [Nitrospirae bacterium]|nr:glycosyltransferase family 1 protein [Nitrospirota bacterium]
MKILLANKFFFPKGGAETVFFQERELCLKQEFAVIDFSMEDERNFPSPFSDYFVPNIDYYDQNNLQQKIRNALFFVHSPVAVRNIERLITKEKPEIAHLHNIYHQLTP